MRFAFTDGSGEKRRPAVIISANQYHGSRQEIEDLLRAADRDLADCGAAGLSADWRLSIAHNKKFPL